MRISKFRFIAVLTILLVLLLGSCRTIPAYEEIVFVPTPAGSFFMGSEINIDERPVHRVTFQEGFHMGAYEVTQKQWMSVMGDVRRLVSARLL